MPALRYDLYAGSAPSECLELHVLARAYRAAWIALHAQAPTGMHRIERLGIAIDFGASAGAGAAAG